MESWNRVSGHCVKPKQRGGPKQRGAKQRGGQAAVFDVSKRRPVSAAWFPAAWFFITCLVVGPAIGLGIGYLLDVSIRRPILRRVVLEYTTAKVRKRGTGSRF